MKDKLSYGYRMLVKVGFFYYWLLSCTVSVVLYVAAKAWLYGLIAELFWSQGVPPQPKLTPLLLLACLLVFIIGLVVMHMR